jgi:formate dehydrogenase subunit gamma
MAAAQINGAGNMARFLARIRLFISLLAVCSVIVFTSPGQAQQQGMLIDPDASAVNEQTLLRQSPRIEGEIVIPDQRESVLIQPAGRAWRYFHETILPWLDAIVIAATLAALLAAYLLLGPIRISAGRSDRKVPRFTAVERFVHWLTAVSFIILGLTGLNMIFGKRLLMPLIGDQTFGVFSQDAKYVHDFMNFPFVMGIMVIAALWLKDNIPERLDLEWFRQGGGFIGSKRKSCVLACARRRRRGFNIRLSDAVPVLCDEYRWHADRPGHTQHCSNPFYLPHSRSHLYRHPRHGGAFEGMWTGEVDFNWAKEHHSLWLEEELAEDRHIGAAPHLSSTSVS